MSSVALSVLGACAAEEPAPEPIDCAGVRVSIQGTTVLRPGTDLFPAYTLSEVGEDDDGVFARVTGVDDDDGGFGTVVLHRGESVEDPVAGVFTLLEADAGDDASDEPGSSTRSASLCLEPHPDFELADGL